MTAIKPFPVCHFIHASADSALILRARHGLQPDQIARVKVLIPQPTMHIIADPPQVKRHPTTDYQAKFSVQYCVAACLVRGRLTLAELEPDALADTGIGALTDRIDCEPDTTTGYPRYFSGGVIITMKNGKELKHMEPINRGTEERALKDDEIVAKFMDNARMVISDKRAKRIMDCVFNIEHKSTRELLAQLA